MATDATLQDFTDYCKSGETEIFSTSFQQLMELFAANFPAEVGTPDSATLSDFVNFSKTDDSTLYTTSWQQISNLIMTGSAWGYNSQSSATNITLTDPVANYQSITMTTTGKKLILPDMNESNSIPLGKPQGLVIENAGSNSFDVYANDGTTAIYLSLTAGQIISLTLINDTTNNGTFIVTDPLGEAALKSVSDDSKNFVASVNGSTNAGNFAVFSDTAGTVEDGGTPGQAAVKSVSDDSKSVVASVNGSTTTGNIAIFSDTAGTVGDGGTPGQAAFKSVSDNSKSSISSINGSTTIGNLAVFSDTTGTIQDGGAPPIPSLTINDQTGVTAYTLGLIDNGCVVILDDASNIALTIPQQTTTVLPVGFNCLIRNVGAGKVTLTTEGSDVLVGNGFVDGAVNSATIVLRKTVSTVNTFDVYGGNAT